MSTVDVSANDFYNSVTGEERGLARRVYKTPLARLAKDDPESFVEVLVFLDLHRRREPDPQARAGAMTVGELQDYFSAAEDGEDEGEA